MTARHAFLAFLRTGAPVTFVDPTGARYHRAVGPIMDGAIFVADPGAASGWVRFPRYTGESDDGRLEEATADHPAHVAKAQARAKAERKAQRDSARRAERQAAEDRRWAVRWGHVGGPS